MWPYGLYHEAPLAFAALGLIGALFAVVLWVRRDWRGAVTVLVWCFFWGWLPATIIGDVQGT